MQDLRITTIQTSLEWERIDLNLEKFASHIREITGDTDVVILPEMFSTGFTMNAAAMAEPASGPTAKWMQRQARQSGALIVGSIIIKEQGAFYNRLHVAFPDHRIETYNKRHLFRMAKEDETFSFGTSRLVVEWKDWRICPLVCYDLRFPVWSRNFADGGKFDYDVIIFVANWPKSRILAWDVLLQARAIENLAYTVGVNRIGRDGNGIEYDGHSTVFGPKGEVNYQAADKEEVNTITLDADALSRYRSKFPANLDADQFEIKS